MKKQPRIEITWRLEWADAYLVQGRRIGRNGAVYYSRSRNSETPEWLRGKPKARCMPGQGTGRQIFR